MLLIIFWTCSSMSISLLHWGAKSWTQYSTSTSLGTWCPPSTCWCHSSQFSLNVDSSVNWSILWGTWELSAQIHCAISHGCCEGVVSLAFVSLLLSCCVDSSGSWERAATCSFSFLVCSAAYGEMAALGSFLWKRVLDGEVEGSQRSGGGKAQVTVLWREGLAWLYHFKILMACELTLNSFGCSVCEHIFTCFRVLGKGLNNAYSFVIYAVPRLASKDISYECPSGPGWSINL